MGESCSIIPFRYENLQAQCAWPGGELVFPLDEVARLLGVKRRAIDRVRVKFPEIKVPPKVCDGLSHTFGPSLAEFGEVTVILNTPGGPQPHVCLTHDGLFRHAVVIRTWQARRFVLAYPAILAAILSGAIRSPGKIAERYRYILDAPRGQRSGRMREVGAELHRCKNTIYRHLSMIGRGEVTPEGLPIMRRPGPPKGYGSKIVGWIREFLLDMYQEVHVKKVCYESLVAEFAHRGETARLPGLSAVSRFL
jgi:hypothetical protein